MKDSIRQITSMLVMWIALASLWIADVLIELMLFTMANVLRIRPTERISWPKGLKQRLMRRQDNTCVYCGYRRNAAFLQIDHMMPVYRGGSNNEDNLQVICRPCNLRKGIQTDEEFRTRYSRLVPQSRLTPPSGRISQKEFKNETRRTTQSASVQHFKRTRYISNREKVTIGCGILGFAVFMILSIALAAMGLNATIVLWPSLLSGGAAGGGVWLRAYVTGAMIESDS